MITYLIELNDIRMSNFLQYFDFSRDAIDVFSVLDASFLKDLNGDTFFSQNVLGHLHFAKRALS